MSNELQHFGVKGMKWGVRRFQPYQKGKKVKGGKEVGKAKSKREIRKENRAAVKEKNNPKGVSLRQLKKERVRMVNEETKKTRKKYQKEIQQDVDKAIKFGEKHGLDLDDGGGGDLAKGAEYTRMWREIEKKQERVSREANRQASNRMIEEFGQDSLSRIEKSYERKAKAAMVGLLSVPVATLGLIAYDELR